MLEGTLLPVWFDPLQEQTVEYFQEFLSIDVGLLVDVDQFVESLEGILLQFGRSDFQLILEEVSNIADGDVFVEVDVDESEHVFPLEALERDVLLDPPDHAQLPLEVVLVPDQSDAGTLGQHLQEAAFLDQSDAQDVEVGEELLFDRLCEFHDLLQTVLELIDVDEAVVVAVQNVEQFF